MRHGLSKMGNDLCVFSPNRPAETKPSELIERIILDHVGERHGLIVEKNVVR